MSEKNTYSDGFLLNSIAEGHEPSFRSFFEQKRVKLFNYLVVLTKSKEIAEELVMDIFLKLWVGRESITDIRNIDAFLQKVAYNKAIDFLRLSTRNRNLQHIIAREMAEIADHSLEHALLDADYRTILDEAIKALSPQRRLVYTLSRDKGLSHDEIARQLHLSVFTVHNHTKEALKSIRGFLRKNNIGGLAILYITLRS